MRVALYTRVSTEDQAKEGFSLEAQLERLEAYCEAQGWEVAERYVDEGHSGRSTRRPAYQRMMEERGRWDMILVLKMDRIHRNSKNFMLMMEDLEREGKGFSSMTESLDTSTALGRFVVDMIQRIAQLESEQIGERTYMGMREKAESGKGMLGFEVPFGYCLEDHLVPDVEEADAVRDMYSWYLGGATMEEIAMRLERKGVATRRENDFTVWSVSRVLHNPIYAGYLRWEELLIKGEHEPIVDIDTFNAVQERVASRIKNPEHRHHILLPAEGEERIIRAEKLMSAGD